MFVSIFYGIDTIWERALGLTHKFLVTPTPRRALVLGKAISAYALWEPGKCLPNYFPRLNSFDRSGQVVVPAGNHLKVNLRASFEPMGRLHVTTLLSILTIAVMAPYLLRRLRSPAAIAAGRITLGTALLAAKLAEFLWYANQGVGWKDLLPLELCDLAAFASIAALLSLNRFCFELAYFWGMGGTMQALLTPDLQTGFPSPDFWFFFIPHGLVLISVFYALALLGLRPVPASIPRVFVATLVSAMAVAWVDWRLGVNYQYLCRKPISGSLMDVLGPWPWYIISLVPLSFFFILLWYSPFWITDRIKAQKNRVGTANTFPPM